MMRNKSSCRLKRVFAAEIVSFTVSVVLPVQLIAELITYHFMIITKNNILKTNKFGRVFLKYSYFFVIFAFLYVV